MGISLGKGLAIAAGIGAVGIGGYMLLKGGGDKNEEPETPDGQDPLAAGGDLTGPPTGTTMAPGADPMTGAGPGTGTATNPGSGAIDSPVVPGTTGQGQQVGPYTVIPDPQSGLNIVFETATKQPVGVLDAQGNVTPITTDAQGNIVLSQEPSTASALGQGSAGPTPHPGASIASSAGSVPVTDSQRGAVYDQIAQELFANASDPTVGAARSDSMAGVSNMAPAVGMQAGAVGASGPTGASTGAGALRSRQAGEYTLYDDGSGMTLVVETAAKNPVAMMDQAGNVTPLTTDASGNLAVAGGGSARTGATTASPTMPSSLGASVPSTSSAAMPGGMTAPVTGNAAPVMGTAAGY